MNTIFSSGAVAFCFSLLNNRSLTACILQSRGCWDARLPQPLPPLPQQHLQQAKLQSTVTTAAGLRDTSSAHYSPDTLWAGRTVEGRSQIRGAIFGLCAVCCQQVKICAGGEKCIHVLDVNDVYVGKTASITEQKPETHGCFTGESFIACVLQHW